MVLVDEVRMDKTFFEVVKTDTPSDAKAFWQTKSIQERLTALEFIRQTVYGYNPDTDRLQRVLEVTRSPWR